MVTKKSKGTTPTEKLLADLKRIGLNPVEVLNRAIILAEIDGNYKEMTTAALGMMPYIAPRLKETQINAEVESTVNGMNGVVFNITRSGQTPVEKVVDGEINDDDEEDEEK